MTELLEKADQFVLDLFKKQLDEKYVYHNYTHTKRVVKSTLEIIEGSQIEVKHKLPLLLAAWLHDTGYIKGCDGHEKESVAIATQFMDENNVDSETQDIVRGLILATKFDLEPETELQEMLRDADSSHFAKDYFEETSELLRQELRIVGINNYSSAEWRDENIRMLTKKHKYYSDYAVKNWNKSKDENLLSLLKAKKKDRKKRKKEKLKVDLKNMSPERSIQTLFRVTLRNHIKLSDIADTKANILLSVNAIIISLALANLIPKLESVSNRHLIIPTLILILFSVASIVLSIMSTRPNVTSGEFTQDQIDKRQVNLLFFGNFHKVPFDKFKDAMNQIINEKDYVYESLLRDLHLLGIVLNRKYKLLRLTYTIFMTGIIVSVIAFIWAFASLDMQSVEIITGSIPVSL